jgi:conjugative transfer pilus assembly protein TraH
MHTLVQSLRRLAAARTLLFILALAGALGAAADASADTGSRMDAYWSGSMGSGSVTGPSAYASQTMRAYSGGNLTLRTPQQSLQLFGFQPPSLSAGCGGIDIFAGGFSYVNSAQLVAFMKAVASNAEGYAFNAALGYLCPTCQKWLNDLQHMAQAINSTNISSCQAASALVNTAFSSLEAGAHSLCSELGTSSGAFSDMVQGWAQCQSHAVSQLAAGSAAAQSVNPTSLNLAWQAIQKNPLLASDQTFAQTMMTITGTLITNCGGDGAGGCTLSSAPPMGDQKTLIAAMLDGGTISILQCDEPLKCLNPTSGQTITIAAASGYKQRVQTLLDDMVQRILSRQPLTTAEVSLVNASPLPVLKVAHVYATAYGIGAQQVLDNYAELIATSLVVSFIEDEVYQVRTAAQNLPNTNHDQITAWNAGVDQLGSKLKAFEATVATQETAYEQIIANTRAVEASLAGAYSNLFAQSGAFNAGQAAR